MTQQIQLCLKSQSLWLFLAGALFTSNVNAVDYDVEVIIFEHLRSTTIGASDTYLLPVVSDAEQIPESPIPGATIQPIGELRLLELRLLEEAEKIKASDNHRMLYHGGWRQGALDKETAPFISVSLGSRFDVMAETNFAIRTDMDEEDEPFSYLRGYSTATAGLQADLRQQRTSKLNGGIKVWVGRFLHFDTLLSYTPQGADYSFAFQSERRMRSRQMHYIDHPRVGIITKIFPVDETAPN